MHLRGSEEEGHHFVSALLLSLFFDWRRVESLAIFGHV